MVPTALLLAAFAGRAEAVAPQTQNATPRPLSSRVYYPTVNEFLNFDKEIKDLEEIISRLKKNLPEEVETIRMLEKLRGDWNRMKEKYKDE